MALRFVGSRLPGSGSLVGDTVIFRHMEMGDSSFSIAEKSVSITGPGGVVTPIVTSTPVGPTSTYVLQAIADEAIGGVYEVIWRLVADGQTVMRREKYVALYNDLYQEVRGIMRVDFDNISDQDIDSIGVQILNSMFGYDRIAHSIGSYQNVPKADVDSFDKAIALMCAAYIRPFTPKQEATGEVTKLVDGTDSTSWSGPERSESPMSIEERWVAQASELLSGTSCLGPLIASIQNVSVTFKANGRRRQRQTPFTFDGAGGLHLNPLFTMWTLWLGVGADFGWSWKGRGLL